jgi:hypothetical protein
MNLGFEAPADAYLVRDAVDASEAPHLVRHYALVASRPDWIEYPVVRTRPGEVLRLFDPDLRGRNGRRLIVEYHTFHWTGDLPELVAERRMLYAAWARSIAQIRAAVDGKLSRWIVSSSLPRETPWI